MQVTRFPFKRTVVCAVAALTVVLLTAVAVSYLPTSRQKMCRSVAMMECRSYYVVRAGGEPLFCFRSLSSDTLLQGVDTAAAKIAEVDYMPACWVNRWALVPSCRGRLLTRETGNADSVRSWMERHGDWMIAREKARMEREMKALDHKASELKYYLNVHNVQDEGFNTVSQYAVKVNHDKDSVAHILDKLKHLRKGVRITVAQVSDYTLLERTEAGKQKRIPCRRRSLRDKSGFILLQTIDGKTPDGACAQSLHGWFPWRADEGDLVFVAGFSGMDRVAFDASSAVAAIAPGHVTGADGRHNIPQILAPDGSPVFSQNGCFLGLSCQGKVVGTKELARLFKNIR